MNAWDDTYRSRGRLWGGVPASLPDLPPDTRVLELGCGDGKTLASMARSGWEVTAVDISFHATALCRNAVPFPAVSFAMADGCSLPFRTAVFDAVFALHVLGHAEGPGRQRMASEIFRVLRNGGELFFRGFAVGDMRYGKGEEIEPGTFRRGNRIITHYFTEQETKELFSRFTPGPVGTGHWRMWIGGKELPRAEIAGRFRKKT